MSQKAGKRAARTSEMRRKSLDLRIAGMSYEQIGNALACSAVTAWRHVQAALEVSRAKTAEDAEKVRGMELRRLDAQLVALWPKRADPRHADTLLRIADRRAKLLGLDAAEKHEVAGPDGGPVQWAVVFPKTEGTDA